MDSKNINIEEIMNIYENSTDGAIRYITRTYGISNEEASDRVYSFYGKLMSEKDSELYNRIQKKNEKINKKYQKECLKESDRQRRESHTNMSNDGSKKAARCPKCKSTSITYEGKKLSIGRAIVGGAIASAPGAVLGGLTSKKGYCVCLNCGKRWKI